MNDAMENIINRINGDFYVGVVGSVRSGKSSFINKFFELKILPNLANEFLCNKIKDELPQTAGGKNIMTVEPKFIPSTSINVEVAENVNMNVRLVDSVGYIIPSAIGYEVDGNARLVKTPWFEEDITFSEAAKIGTKKVMTNHSNLGIVITSDGSFGDFSRMDYQRVEDEVITEMISLEKPFVVILNTKNITDENTLKTKQEIEEKYNVTCLCIDIPNMTNKDIDLIFSGALSEFKIEELTINLPDYISVLDDDISLKAQINEIMDSMKVKYSKFKDIKHLEESLTNTNIFSSVKTSLIDSGVGSVVIDLDLDESKYKEVLQELLGSDIVTKADFVKELYENKKAKKVYSDIGSALQMAKESGYGVSVPSLEEMKLLPPTLVKQSGRYGVKLCAVAPSIHLIKVDVSSTFTPIIGSEAQSQMLIENLINDESNPDEVWNKEIFGRKLSEIVNDGIKAKLYQFPEISKEKLKNVLDKLINSNSNSVIAIIL